MCVCRSCDKNKNKKVTLREWTSCLVNRSERWFQDFMCKFIFVSSKYEILMSKMCKHLHTHITVSILPLSTAAVKMGSPKLCPVLDNNLLI